MSALLDELVGLKETAQAAVDAWVFSEVTRERDAVVSQLRADPLHPAVIHHSDNVTWFTSEGFTVTNLTTYYTVRIP